MIWLLYIVTDIMIDVYIRYSYIKYNNIKILNIYICYYWVYIIIKDIYVNRVEDSII